MPQKNFRVYKSSAGSGKTFTLVREYLRIVLNDPYAFRSILAITFTNKAANEMKTRIVSSLVSLTAPPDSWPGYIRTLIEPIRKEGNFDDAFIRRQAIKVVSLILHNYSDLAASTIDSFMQRVIRTFSTDLNLPQNYEVELDVDLLRQRAVDRLIDLAGSDKELTTLLVHYLETKTVEDKSWRIENDLNKVAEALFREDGLQHRDALNPMDYASYREYYGKINGWLNDFENAGVRYGEEALKVITGAGLETGDFAFGNAGPPGYFLKLAGGQIGELAEPPKRIVAAVNEGVWAAKKQSREIVDKINSVAPHLTEIYNQSRTLITGSITKYKTLRLILANLYPLAVLGSIANILGEIREEERILPISEFNRIIAKVTQTETIPYIYERLGERFRHLMIDEFQDTSVLQWQNLLPLVENAISENHLNLIVGDAKQAIYRWRSGEVEQFIALPRLFGDQTPVTKLREQALISQFEEYTLPVNWRSHKAIVEFNNAFFRHIASRLEQPFKGIYDALDQRNNLSKPNGLVQVEFFDPGQDSDDLMLERLPGLIGELLSSGYKLRDITVLCRKNKEGSKVANRLLEEGIRVISSESLLLGSSDSVRLIVSMMRLVADAGNQLAYAEVLALLACKGSLGARTFNDALASIRVNDGSTRNAGRFSLDSLEDLLQQCGFGFSRNRIKHLPLYDLAVELIAVMQLSSRYDIFLQSFQNELHKLTSSRHFELKDLADWWEEKGSAVSVIFPENLDAIKVMTIHKSKGLEFPVVIFPFATSELRLTVDHVWVPVNDPMLENLKTARLPVQSLGGTDYEQIKADETRKSLLDLVNLMYVAFTRAEERLYILTEASDPKNKDKNTIPSFLYDFISITDPSFSFSTETPWRYQLSVENEHIGTESRATSFFELNEYNPTRRWQQKVVTTSRRHGGWYGSDVDAALSFGTTLHAVLAAVKTREDLSGVMHELKLAGELSESDEQRLIDSVNRVLSHPDLQGFFSGSPNVLCEPEILLPGGETLRPDRILTLEEEIIIAEFKTGIPRDSHTNQIRRYREVLQSINNRKVKGLLVYTGAEDCEVHLVS